MKLLSACAALLCLAAVSSAGELPDHPPLRVLIVSDEVNPHGLSAAELTQPGEIAAALQAPGAGLNLDAGPDAVLEIPTDDLHLATAALSQPFGSAAAYDVLIYFAHRIPADDSPAQNLADQDAFTAAVQAFLEDGGGVVGFHHGLYTAGGKAGILDLLGGTASSVAWNTSTGQRVIDVSPGHFVSTNSVEYDGSVSYADAANGVPSDDYAFFTNLPDERYPAFAINPGAGDIELLFASDYAQNGSTHVLGFTHRRPEWAGAVVAYQPGESQPQALDDLDGNNFQILLNAILYASQSCVQAASWSEYGDGLAGTLGVPAISIEGHPALGHEFHVQLGNALGAPLSAVMFAGFAQAALPAKGGLVLVAPPWIMVNLELPTSGLSLPAKLPFQPSACGLELDLQLVQFPDPAAPAGFSFSRGVSIQLGH